MEPLIPMKLALMSLRMYPFDVKRDWWQRVNYKLGYKLCVTFPLFFMSVAFVMSVIYFVEVMSVDLQESLFMIFQIAASGESVIVIFIGFTLRYKIFHLFEELSQIYQKYSDDDSFKYLSRANAKSEFALTMLRYVSVYTFTIVTPTMSILSVVFCYMKYGELDVNAVFSTFRLNLPWNQEKLAGYAGQMLIYTCMGDSYCMVLYISLAFFISLCLHHQAFFQIFDFWLGQISRQQRRKKQHLHKIIDFHNMTQIWFTKSTKIFSLFIAAKLVTTIVYLASIVFQLDMQMQNLDYEIAFLLFAISLNYGRLFLYCYFGKLATHCYEQMSRSLFESNWMELPVDLQKYFVMMIANAQRRRVYHGCGIVDLNLETFTKIIKIIFTYYMVFKTVTQ